MTRSGHRTEAVYRRYAIVSESDLAEAVKRTQAGIDIREPRSVVP